MRVLVQLRSSPAVLAPMGVGEPAPDVTHDLESRVPTLTLDHDFPIVQVPRPVPVDPSGDPLSMMQPMSFSFDPEESTYLVRGEIADAAPARVALLTASHPDIVGVFADPRIETTPVYCGEAPVGTADDVRTRLGVSNSGGIFDPSWDFPVGSPGNYSDNPAHPFNIIVGSLAQAGADILFAAGNCGRDCPDSRCRFGNARPINGANSHPQVISVAGIDVRRRRVGYSSQGPGRLADQKPDVSSYTHFLGSEAEGAGEADSGTSAACPVMAGVVGAMRTKFAAGAIPPA